MRISCNDLCIREADNISCRKIFDGEFMEQVKLYSLQSSNDDSFISENSDTSAYDKFQEEISAVIEQNRGYKCRNKRTDTLSTPTQEELRAVARARARKKARLDAYFHLLEKVCIKRKIVENENAKRGGRKVYCFTTLLDRLAESRRIIPPPEHKL